MSRKVQVSLVLALLIAVVLILNWGPIWRLVAYDRSVAPSGLVMFTKRARFLPGSDRIIPEQTCPDCRAGKHGHPTVLESSDVWTHHCSCTCRAAVPVPPGG